MLGLGPQDVWWASIAAFGAAFAGWFALKTRLGMTWILKRARQGYIDWFRDAVDEHVEPKFVELRHQTEATAVVVKEEAVKTAGILHNEVEVVAAALAKQTKNTAADMKQVLMDHANQEASENRVIVREEIAPLIEQVVAHIEADAEAFGRNDEGQTRTDQAIERIEEVLSHQPTTEGR